MKRLAIVAAIFVFILLLTKIANQAPPPALEGTTFWLKGQHVWTCTSTDITLVDERQHPTHLNKDESWPDCSTFQKDMVLDFDLARGDKTKLISYEQTAWWRKAL